MTESNSTISISSQGDVVILTILAREIRQHEVADQMSREFDGSIEGAVAPKVVVDMSNVEFMSSVAYLPFVGLRGKVLQAGGALALCNFSDVIKDMFEAARLLVNPRSPSAPFQFADTADEAIQLVRSQ